MHTYLARFRDRLKPWEGSLVRPAQIEEPSAKEYLASAAREGLVESVTHGWYYLPPAREPETVFDFLARDRGFKVVTAQSAASVWNGDFIHRNIVTVAVEDQSYGRALKEFGAERGWAIRPEVNPEARKIPATKVGRLRVEEREEAIAECFQRWAFIDGVATLTPETSMAMKRDHYWKRIRGTDVRVGQAIEYAAHRRFGVGREVRISNDFVREDLDEAIEKVDLLA